MILDVDAGNTRLKWRLRSADQVVARGAETAPGDMASLTAVAGSVEAVRVASVGTDADWRQLVLRLAQVCRTQPRFAVPGREFQGLRSAYADPAQMGVDRWLAMVAAWQRYRSGLVIIDAGSALTIDYVDQDGQHLGGYILPGWHMHLKGLLEGTARVFADGIRERPGVAPGRNTSACVNQGLAWLWASWGARLEADRRRLGLVRVIISGGDSDHVLDAGVEGEVWPELVMDGLAALPETELVGPL